MNVLTTSQLYINEMIKLAGPGMKILLMDKETTSIVSCSFPQSELMQKEVYLFERIDSLNIRDSIKYIKAIVFLRPTFKNVQLLIEELQNPRYSLYYIYFSNIIPKTEIKKLASNDNCEVVRDLHEFFLDSIPLSTNLLTLGLPNCYTIKNGVFKINEECLERMVEMLAACSLSFKRKPIVRYQRNSKNCARLAEGIDKLRSREEDLFENCNDDVLILILERSEDPITPLLNQWTYEAMVHELFGINNNKVVLNLKSKDDKGNIVDEEKKFVLNCLQDDFYATNMYLNFGEIGQNIKQLMTEHQEKAKTHQKLDSIQDMKKFIENYPQFRKISGTLSKHVQIVSELAAIVAREKLMEISELEQTMFADGDHNTCLANVRKLLQDFNISDLNAVRLVMIYGLRFEGHANNSLPSLLSMLRQRNVDNKYFTAIENLFTFAGSNVRQGDLFKKNPSASEIAKRFIKGFKGIENIFTEHDPYILRILEDIVRGRLTEQSFPYIWNDGYFGVNGKRIEGIIVYIIGGATYEESAAINLFNLKKLQNPSYPKVVLASNYVHNTKSFIDMLSSNQK
ncbi:Sec1-like protein family and Sec1-like, domain 2-containing protein [Strongyloides ratti]|uniref:Sec1-like protein family and Sec1-like, domain 2-containing protein n=1 Tax=Strongyloides ratti TaxID=34506 RepID=A0A090LGZ8_STRRB|nr:Sec1-like protein family and Sec1-like, domain 2-containing protein [Strongyloides ratti]CEF69057.1 Sec1-like protein family and Sec1-like, domain 2-containing protein [Strongyloides ratti]